MRPVSALPTWCRSPERDVAGMVPVLKPPRVVILDGGLSNALETRGADLGTDLWTARVVLEQPSEIVAVHRAYYAAGADVATTASYQASVPSLAAAGLDRPAAEELLRSTVRLARRARDEEQDRAGDRRLFVAASVGPYGAVLADGSEYRGDYELTASQLRDFHGPRLEVLASAGPDLIAVETIPDLREAEVLVPLLDELGLPAWFSYTVADRRTRAGQSLAEAYAVLAGSSSLAAAGVNCADPAEVAGALEIARAATGLPGVAYPNRGEVWDSAAKEWVGEQPLDVSLAPTWVAQGAAYVGGCCRVGPGEIAELAAVLRS